ncbi:MAG: DUF2760 domain-containing protein [Desulfobacula sp.]|nr:DUF2760 domain-containing protein [Desulfobacula sp.]
MADLKKYSKKCFWIIVIFMLLVAAGVNAGLYQGINWLKINFNGAPGNDILMQNISNALDSLEFLSSHFYTWVVPLVLSFFLLMGLILWIILKNSNTKEMLKGQGNINGGKSKKRSKKDFVDQKIEQERKRRLFLHSFSILQRDGRLLDFFDEDLSLYDDEQIGAAVRSVQEDCKKTIKKYINLKPVVESEEGEKLIVEAGFDIDSIKLIGNVAGEPPFEGVVKHRGWKAGKKEVPKLSDIQDSAMIMPAEIEIQ